MLTIIDRKEEPAALEAKRQAAAEQRRLLAVYSGKETVKQAQTNLNEAGFPCGTSEGMAGKKTTAAPADSQTAMVLSVTGAITHETLIRMGLAGWFSPQVQAAEEGPVKTNCAILPPSIPEGGTFYIEKRRRI